MILENADPAQSYAGSQSTHWSCKTHGVKVYFDKMWIWQHSTGKNCDILEMAESRDAAAALYRGQHWNAHL